MRKNRRNAFYLIAALALLGLGACSNENNENGNGNIVPGREGMVTFRVPVSVDEGAGTKTRSAESEPIHFSNDLGNGFVLESTLTVNETPKTRASQLLMSTYFLMIAFDGSSSPVGCERLQTAADGTLTFELPKETNYRLVFYSLNDGSDGSSFDPTQYISGGGVTNDYEEGTYQALSSGASLKSGVSIPLYTESSTHHDYCPHDVICASTKINTAQVPSSVELHFKHLFAQINWKVISNTGNGENISAISAGFYPRFASAQLKDLSKMPATDGTETITSEKLQAMWQGSTSQATADDHWSDTSDDNDLSGEPYSSIFIPASTAASAHIHLKNLTFVANGITKTVNDYDIPILDSDKEPVSFQPGNSYTVTSYLTRPKVKFAYSNIFWDGKNLNFYTDKTTLYTKNDYFTASLPATTDPAGFQGLFFRWGSTIGIDPSPTFFSTHGDIQLYIPSATGDGTYQTPVAAGTYTPDYPPNLHQVSTYNTFGWHDFSDTNNFVTAQWESTRYRSTDGNNYGDVCAYLTNGEWRLPTSWEQAQRVPYSLGNSWDATWNIPQGTWKRSDSWSKPSLEGNIYGTSIAEGQGYATYVPSGSKFVAAGFKDARGIFYSYDGISMDKEYQNSIAAYYSSSAAEDDDRGDLMAVQNAYDETGHAVQGDKTMSYPCYALSIEKTYIARISATPRMIAISVRCVKNSGISLPGFIDDGESTGTLAKP